MPAVPVANGIFSATYSNVPVFEFNVKGHSVMRRRSDDYINATHILKVCDYDKPTRTRILERDVQKGVHEKVQGGYGKYQGTWIPLHDGASLAQRNSVYSILAPIFEFEFQPGARSPPPAPKHVTAASHKPKLPKAPAVKKQKTQPKMPQSQMSDGPYYDGNSVHYEQSPQRSSIISASEIGEDDYQYRPRGNFTKKRKRDDETRFQQEQEHEWTIFGDSLLDYFVTESHLEAPQIPQGYPIDHVIDDQNHTGLHWAAAMGDVNMVRTFLEHGANPMTQNVRGETPAMRCVIFTNCFETSTLAQILDLLDSSWEHTDYYGGNLLHHVAMTTSSVSRRHCARLYFTVIGSQMQTDLLPHEFDRTLNAQDRQGNTALHIVARNKSKKNIKALLGFGARTDIVGSDGMTVDQILGTARRKMDEGPDFPFTSSPLREPKETGLHSGDAAHQIAAAAHYRTKAAQSFSDSFSDSIPAKGLQLSLAMDAESQEQDQNLAESQQLVKRTVEEITAIRQSITRLQDELQTTADDHFHKSQQHEKLEATTKAYLEQHQHRQLHEDVGAEEEAVPDAAIHADSQPNGLAPNESRWWDSLRAATDLLAEQNRRRQLTQQMVEALKTAGVSDKGESMTKLIASTANVPLETVAQSIPELLEQLQAEKDVPNRGIVGLQSVVA